MEFISKNDVMMHWCLEVNKDTNNRRPLSYLLLGFMESFVVAYMPVLLTLPYIGLGLLNLNSLRIK